MKRRVLLVAVLFVPTLAFAIPNPLRVYVPWLFGLHCDDHKLCVDDPTRFESARNLVVRAQEELAPTLGPLPAQPRLFFCSTQQCFDVFGKRRSTAVSFADVAVVIGPRAWLPQYVKHELIHVAQYENLGLIRVWRMPKWLREGMAYSLSADPRRPLPGELELWRKQFESWYAADQGSSLWARLRASASNNAFESGRAEEPRAAQRGR